jgi:hypothetical protein
MTVVLILVVLWGVAIGIPAARWIQRRSGQGSIDSFHHSLDTLERSGPKLVVPAYRLSGSGAQAYGDEQRNATFGSSAKPKLVLLRPLNGLKGDAMYHEDDAWTDDDSGERYERVYTEQDGYTHDDEYFGAGVASGSSGRRIAAAKRRKIVLSLAGVFIGTLILGFAMSVLWDLTLIAFLGLVGYVGLMARAALAEGGTERATLRPSLSDRLKSRLLDDAYDDDAFDDYEDQGYEETRVVRGGGERHIAHHVAQGSSAQRDSDEYYDEEDWYEEPRRAVGR